MGRWWPRRGGLSRGSSAWRRPRSPSPAAAAAIPSSSPWPVLAPQAGVERAADASSGAGARHLHHSALALRRALAAPRDGGGHSGGTGGAQRVGCALAERLAAPPHARRGPGACIELRYRRAADPHLSDAPARGRLAARAACARAARRMFGAVRAGAKRRTPPPPPRAALDPCAGWPGRRREGEGGPAGREHARMPTPCSRRTQMGQAVVQLPAALRMLVASSAAVAGLATVRSTCRELLLLDPGLARRLPSAVYVLNRLLGCGAGQGALRGARWSTATTTPTHTRVHKHAGVPPVHPTGLGLCWCLGGARRTPAERPPASARCCRPFCCCCWQCCCRVARRY